MKHGALCVITLIHCTAGTLLKQMSSVTNLDSLKLVSTISALMQFGSYAFYAGASTPRFGRGSLPVIAYSVNCRGFESSLAECTFSTSSRSTCYSWESIVGVVCKYGMEI